MGLKIEGINHVAVIASDVDRSLEFYNGTLGFPILNKTFRRDRGSWKIDLQVDSNTQIELFTFPNPPQRVTNPEALGLRHLAFSVGDIEQSVEYLKTRGIEVENVRLDELTGRKFTFFRDPDKLPLELYEIRDTRE